METSGPVSRTPPARARQPLPGAALAGGRGTRPHRHQGGAGARWCGLACAELYRTDVRLVKSAEACVRLSVMPLYEYRCNDCSAVYELLRPMADREVAAVCPSCESRASMPLISRVAVHAGSGPDASPSTGGGGGCCG